MSITLLVPFEWTVEKNAGIPRGLTGPGQAGQTQSAHEARGGPFYRCQRA